MDRRRLTSGRRTASADRPSTVSLEEKVAFLGSSDAYPDHPARVDIVETHMSWVFLAGESVYKLKKPVRYPFLDFSTIAARKADSYSEVRLNQRLAPGIYVGVVPLTVDSDGTPALDGDGAVIDWLVRMRRLPADRMLDRLIERNAVCTAEIDGVAGVLADFYRHAQPTDLTPADYIAGFEHEQATNRSVLVMSKFDLPPAAVNATLTAVDDFIAREADTLAARVRSEFVVEGHGDLRPEHICLLDPPVVIDCLEFNRTLRQVDPINEIALLGLECDRLGAGWIGERIIDHCRRVLEDTPSDRLVAFYTAFRALLRARLALAHLLDPRPRNPGRWVPLARQYLALAEQACLRLVPPAGRRSIHPRDSA